MIFRNTKTRGRTGTAAGDAVIYFLLLVAAFVTLFPFWHVMMYSISDSRAAMSGGLFVLPREPTFISYQMLVKTKQMFTAFYNSTMKTMIGTAFNLVITALTAYPLSLKRFKGRSVLSGFVFFSMLFNGGIIPTYLLIRSLHLLDTFWVYVIPGMMNAYNMFILRNYFATIPDSLEESAMLDGANPLQTLLYIILPVSGPALAAIAMFYGVANWNSYMDGVLYVNKQSLQLLQVFLRLLIGSAGAKGALSDAGILTEASRITEETMKMTVITASVIPVLFVYPFLQKYYTKGVMVGSVKG